MTVTTSIEAAETDPTTKLPDTRGKLQVLISDEGFEAGRINTISIIVSNPFDVPVEILDIQAPRSSHLKLTQQMRGGLNNIPGEKQQKTRNKPQIDSIGEESELLPKANPISRIFRQFSESVINFSLGSAAFGGVSFQIGDTAQVKILAEEGAEVEFEQRLGRFDKISLVAEKNSKIKIKDSAQRELEAERGGSLQTIEPHCELVAYMPLLTQGWMFFKPQRMNLTYLIRYKIGGGSEKILTQVVNSALDIRPPLRSVVIGSVLGSVLGSGAKYAQHIGQGSILNMNDIIAHAPLEVVQLVGAAIMSIIAAVALSRKSGAQSFITVEDFFGGFVVGVLIGYQGTSYFENILGHLGPGAELPSAS